MRLKRLTIKDKKLFDKFLGLTPHELSVFAFENIYIWGGLFKIEWLMLRESLCIFFRDSVGSFLYLPPLTQDKNTQALGDIFRILDKFNKNKEVSRIENVEEKDLSFYEGLGYACKKKSYDYLCSRSDLARLSGNRFKSKRACFNYFIKHYDFAYLPFVLKDRQACLELYDCWMRERKGKNQDPLYQGMLEDSWVCFKKMLDSYSGLDITGRVVKIYGGLKAFTFGFRLSRDTFCVLYEVADLTIAGLSQFIFREFSRELKEYKYINIMDDSGLENLKKVKLSYQPQRLIPAYIVSRKDA